MNRSPKFTRAAIVAMGVLVLSGCAASDDYNREQRQIDQSNYLNENPEFEGQVDRLEEDIYEERLFEACWDANAGPGVSEDDLIAYCEANLYEYEDLGAGGGVAPSPQIDEINDCFNGSIEVYLFSYTTSDGSGGSVDVAAMCLQDAEMAASQKAPPGAFLFFVDTV